MTAERATGAERAAAEEVALDAAGLLAQRDLTAAVEALATLLRRVLDEDRIRHDHAYPMELGPHHCDGCDLIDALRAALTHPGQPGEGAAE